MALLNRYNFFRWSYNTDPETDTLPQAYILERCLYDHMPIVVPGEDLAFYINTQSGINYSGTLTMQFVKNGIEYASGATLLEDVISGSNYNIYTDFEIPALGNGVYYMQIKDGSGVIKLTSNKVLCLNENYSNISSYLSFTNNTNLYNVRYGNLGTFSQKMRLRITDVTGGDYAFNQEMYQSETTGAMRKLLSINQQFYTFEAYFFDRYAFEALACFLGHYTTMINTKTYSFKDGLTHAPILSSCKTKGTFQMYDQSFVTVNKCSGSVASS